MLIRFLKEKPFFLTLMILTVLISFLWVGIIIPYQNDEKRLTNLIGSASDDLTWLQQVRYTLKLSRNLEVLVQPAAGEGNPSIISVEEGEPVLSVAQKIFDTGFLQDKELLLDYLVYRGFDKKILPGRYALQDNLSIRETGDRLIDPAYRLVSLTLLPGLRLEEIAELISHSGLEFSSEAFLNATRNYPAEFHPAGGSSLEGYLLSGTYEFKRSISLESFLNGFVHHFQEMIDSDMVKAFNRNGIRVEQAVIMASMISREAMEPEEYPIIASVFYNRLRAGMRFESDPTVQYAAGWDQNQKTWWKNPLSLSDLSAYSEYNTYIISGFPKGPISNTSYEILQAVANPESTPFFYFRAKCDGSPFHNFAVTYEEHLRNDCN